MFVVILVLGKEEAFWPQISLKERYYLTKVAEKDVLLSTEFRCFNHLWLYNSKSKIEEKFNSKYKITFVVSSITRRMRRGLFTLNCYS